MSKYIDDIIKDIKTNPETYSIYYSSGLKKDNIKITSFGDFRLFPIMHVYIKDISIPTSYIDNWRLGSVMKKWYKNVSLEQLKERNLCRDEFLKIKEPDAEASKILEDNLWDLA